MLVLVIERSLASGDEGQQTVAAQKEGSTLWADPMSGCYIDLERGRGATLFCNSSCRKDNINNMSHKTGSLPWVVHQAEKSDHLEASRRQCSSLRNSI